MGRLAGVAAILAAGFAAGEVVGVEAPRSTTVLGSSNRPLADGAAALSKGRAEEGIRLTLMGLQLPASRQDQAAGHSNLCAGYAMLRRWDEALPHCNKAVELDSNNWRTFNNRAAVLAGKGLYDQAIDDLRVGLRLAPGSPVLNESLQVIEKNRRILAARSRSSVLTR